MQLGPSVRGGLRRELCRRSWRTQGSSIRSSSRGSVQQVAVRSWGIVAWTGAGRSSVGADLRFGLGLSPQSGRALATTTCEVAARQRIFAFPNGPSRPRHTSAACASSVERLDYRGGRFKGARFGTARVARRSNSRARRSSSRSATRNFSLRTEPDDRLTSIVHAAIWQAMGCRLRRRRA